MHILKLEMDRQLYEDFGSDVDDNEEEDWERELEEIPSDIHERRLADLKREY
jgi:hypothetical protein